MYRRANARWTVNECLRLEREFDLLELSIQEIAELHERSPNAIMYKLDAENIADYNDVYQNRQQKLKVDTNYEEDVDNSENADGESDTNDSEYNDEASEEDINDNEEDINDNGSEDSEYDRYNIKQQIKLLTKHVKNLTGIVYNAFTAKKNSGEFSGQSFAGFH